MGPKIAATTRQLQVVKNHVLTTQKTFVFKFPSAVEIDSVAIRKAPEGFVVCADKSVPKLSTSIRVVVSSSDDEEGPQLTHIHSGVGHVSTRFLVS